MMRTRATSMRLAVVVAAVALLVPLAAAAAPPQVFTTPVDRHFLDTFSCDFPVDVHRVGTTETTVIEVAAGQKVLVIRHQEFAETFTNLLTGEAITTRVLRTDSSWPDLVGTANGDGTISFFQDFHGVYRLRVLQGEGAVEIGAGHWVVEFVLGTDGRLREKGFVTFVGSFPAGLLALPSEICAQLA